MLCGKKDGASDSDESGWESNGEDATDRALSALDYHLSRPLRMRWRMERLFKEFADCETEDGKQALSGQAIQDMTEALSEETDIPMWVFQGLEVMYDRFDFSGDGLLEKQEVMSMYRTIMKQRRIGFGGRGYEVPVPTKTMAQAGYTVEKELGRGGQGAMYLASKSYTSVPYCVKFYDKEDGNAADLDELIDEFELMKDMSNKSVAKTYEVFQDSSYFYLVNQPYFGGDLTKIGARALKQGVRMSEAWWRGIFKQCMEGLDYLHSKAIIHCDIKEPNIMIADGDDYSAPNAVLIDFGLASPFANTAAGISGTPGYIPPETFQTQQWQPRGDIFSMGITFFQLLTGNVPTSDGSVMGVLQRGDYQALTLRVAVPWQEFPQGMPVLGQLVASMLVANMYERPRAFQVLEHEWFSSDSDADLPQNVQLALAKCGNAEMCKDKLIEELIMKGNLDELRALHEELEGKPHAHVESGGLLQLLQKHGISGDAAKEFVAHCKSGAGNARQRLLGITADAVQTKETYSLQFVKDLFKELDADNSGFLSASELEALLHSDAFECHYGDVSDLIRDMGPNAKGEVSFDNFKKAVMEDGRISRRTEAEAGCRAPGCVSM